MYAFISRGDAGKPSVFSRRFSVKILTENRPFAKKTQLSEAIYTPFHYFIRISYDFPERTYLEIRQIS